MTIPALYDACTANPEATVVMITRRSMTGLFINHPENLIIEGVDLTDYKGATGMWRLMALMAKCYRFTAYVDLQDSFQTRLLRLAARLHGINTFHIDNGAADKKRLTRRRGKVTIPLTNSTDRYRMALAAAGLSASPKFSSLFDNTPANPEIYAPITPPHPNGEVWIGIAPFAVHEGKIYPVHLMEQVLRELSSRSNTKIFLFGGGPYEQKILSEWARKYPSTISLAGKRHGFEAEFTLFHDLDAMISMDSANMHMAALAGANVVAVWGATHPYCGYGGWHIPDENNIQLPIPCRPCSVFGNKSCLTSDYRCLAGIRPTVITERIDRILENQLIAKN